jgi:hypothetical protein
MILSFMELADLPASLSWSMSTEQLKNTVRLKKVIFLFFIYCIQHCFICRPSDLIVSEDPEIQPMDSCDFGIDCQTL